MRFEEFRAQEAESLRPAAAQAGLERYGLKLADFARALHLSAERYAPEARGRELKAFLLDLRLEDLALATACALGTEAAWEEFDRTYRKYLENVAGDDEVAAEVIAGLYGTGRAGGRIGQFRGRSSLKGWLRAIVAVTIRFRAIAGGGMEDNPNVSNLKAASAIFYLDGDDWTADGRPYMNLSPAQTIEYYRQELESVE